MSRMSSPKKYLCGKCAAYDSMHGLCLCSDSSAFRSTVNNYKIAGCGCFKKKKGKAKQEEIIGTAKTGPCICKNCGAYIPTGKSACIACGMPIGTENRQKPHSNTGGNGFAPPVTMEPPPPPDMPKRNAENVLDIDLDALQKGRTVVRIKRNGGIKNYLAYPTTTSLDFYIYPYTRCSDIRLVLELRALDVIEGE